MWENEYEAFLSELRRSSEAFHMGGVRGINETRLDDMREINNQTPQLVALAKQITLLVAMIFMILVVLIGIFIAIICK